MKTIVLLIILLPTFVFAQSSNQWPTTLDEAVEILIEELDEQAKIQITQTMEESLAKYHHGWGTGIRNEFGLRQGNNRLLASCGSERMSADKASSVIIHSVWEKLRSQMQPEMQIAYEQLERAIRKVEVLPCDSECNTIGKTVEHMNKSIALSQSNLNNFEILIDPSINHSEELQYSEDHAIPLSIAISRFEFRANIVKQYLPPRILFNSIKKK